MFCICAIARMICPRERATCGPPHVPGHPLPEVDRVVFPGEEGDVVSYGDIAGSGIPRAVEQVPGVVVAGLGDDSLEGYVHGQSVLWRPGQGRFFIERQVLSGGSSSGVMPAMNRRHGLPPGRGREFY